MQGTTFLFLSLVVIIGCDARERSGYPKLRKPKEEGPGIANENIDDSSKLRSAEALLRDPRLEAFKFILPNDPGFQTDDSKTIPTSKYIAAIRYYQGDIPERKVFKVKVLMQSRPQKKYRKLKGNLVFPRNISTVAGECQWDLNSRNGKKIVFVPKACVKMIVKFDEKRMDDYNVIALLIPKRNKLYGMGKRKITKKFVLVGYGKRMGALVRQLAVRQEFARLLVTKKRHERSKHRH